MLLLFFSFLSFLVLVSLYLFACLFVCLFVWFVGWLVGWLVVEFGWLCKVRHRCKTFALFQIAAFTLLVHLWRIFGRTSLNRGDKTFFQVEYEVKGDPGLGQASIPRLARTSRSNKVKVITFNKQLITP